MVQALGNRQRVEVTEAALEASQERLRLATDAAGIGIWVWNITLDQVTWENDKPYEIFGLPRNHEPINAARFFADFVHPDDRAKFEEAVRITVEQGAPFFFLGRFRRADGALRWAEFSGRVQRTGDGSPLQVIGTSADVTSREEVEEQIRRAAEANAKFRTMFEQGMQFAGILTLDGIVVEANRLCVDGCGFTREEVVGKPFWECGWWNRSPVLIDRIRTACLDAAAGRLFRSETSYFVANGSERCVDLTIAPVTDEAGRALFIVPTGTDITDRKRTELELRHTGERLKLLLENTKDYAVIISDPKNTILEWQGGAARITGYSAAEAIGKSVDIIFTPEDRAAGVPAEEMAKATWSGRADDKRWHLRNDNSRFFADGVMNPLYDEAGKLRGFGKVFRDATAQKQAEDALRTSEEQLQFALRAGRMGTWHLNLQTRELSSSDTCKGNYGVAAADPFTYDDLVSSILDEDRGAWQQVFDDAIARGAEFQIEYRVRWPDTSIHWCHARASCATDGRGEAVALSGVSINIDRRKWTEERLELLDAVNEGTRSASDPAAIMAATTRLLGGHLRATRCAYADVEPDGDRFTIRDDWNARGARSTVGVYTLARFGQRTAALLQSGSTLVVNDLARELLPSDGGDMFSAIGIKAVICCPLVKEGRVAAMMAVHQDTPRNWTSAEVTLVEEVGNRSWAHIERVRAAEELRVQARQKDEFLATLAHELRNPLAPIRTGLHVLKMSPPGPAAERAREMMDRQLGHMVRLVDDLLDVSRISRGKFELKRERVHVRAVLENAVEVSRPLIDAAQHTLTVRVPEHPVWLEGDLTRLAQVVSNLLNNSAKYTPNKGHIDLSAVVESDHVVIRVSDNGTGVSPEMLPDVFDLFAQVNRTLDRAQGGLGIGLSLARKLVEMHGGTVEAESAGVGQGSTFTVRLPTVQADTNLAQASQTEESVVAAIRPASKRILVVDDNLDGAELLASMLELSGHETRTAHDGPQALDVARAFLPHIVFLDIGLPGMNGYEVARELRSDAQLSRVGLIALTGWGSQDDKRRTNEAGFDYHLTKPVDYSAVEEVIAKLEPEPAEPPPKPATAAFRPV